MKKPQTNEQKLKRLIKENPSILNALLLERILFALDITKTDIEENPNAWNNCIIHPSLYLDLYNNAKEILK